jgi:hypothetical protein
MVAISTAASAKRSVRAMSNTPDAKRRFKEAQITPEKMNSPKHPKRHKITPTNFLRFGLYKNRNIPTANMTIGTRIINLAKIMLMGSRNDINCLIVL